MFIENVVRQVTKTRYHPNCHIYPKVRKIYGKREFSYKCLKDNWPSEWWWDNGEIKFPPVNLVNTQFLD